MKITGSYIRQLSFFTLLTIANLSAQQFPQDLGFSERTEALIDAGMYWEINSTFHPLDYNNLRILDDNDTSSTPHNWLSSYLQNYMRLIPSGSDESKNSFDLLMIPGFTFRSQTGAARKYDYAMEPSLLIETHYDRKWYGKIFFRATGDSASLDHYSGVPRKLSRFGMNTGEIDRSEIGYNGDKLNIGFGRGRQIWGPFAEDNLMLSGNSPAYEQLKMQIEHKSFKFRYFLGFLQTELDDEVNIHRYLVGRAIEYSNRKNLVIGIGEASILAGKNRPLDFAHINPLALHFEVEQNDRENDQSRNLSNFFWFLNVDWFLFKSLRVTGSVLLDEILIDRKDYDDGGDDKLGLSGRLAWTPLRGKTGLTVFAKAIRIDTFTYLHNYNYTNFNNRGKTLGHPLGNDADDYSVGGRVIFSFPALFEAEIGRKRWGDKSIHAHPYDVAEIIRLDTFPSGNIRSNRYLKIKVDSQITSRFALSIDGWLDLEHSGEDSGLERWTIEARYLLPIVFTGL